MTSGPYNTGGGYSQMPTGGFNPFANQAPQQVAAAGSVVPGSGIRSNYTGQSSGGWSGIKEVPQIPLQTSGFAGMGYAPTPQTFTQEAKPNWMQGVWDMPSWGMDAVSGAPLGQADLQPAIAAPEAGATAPIQPQLPTAADMDRWLNGRIRAIEEQRRREYESQNMDGG